MPHVEVPSAEFKVVLLGDTNTGKTCLVLRFVEGSFRPSGRSATIGAFFLTKRLTVNNITCKMLLWDTAGQDQFQRLAKTYYQNAAAAIVCYDISNPRSLGRLKKTLDELHRYRQSSSPMVLTIAACKSDLSSVPGLEEEAKRLAKVYDAIYVPTSAKSNEGVSEVFQNTAARVLEWHESAATGHAKPLHVTVGALTPRDRISPSNNNSQTTPNNSSDMTNSSMSPSSNGFQSSSLQQQMQQDDRTNGLPMNSLTANHHLDASSTSTNPIKSKSIGSGSYSPDRFLNGSSPKGSKSNLSTFTALHDPTNGGKLPTIEQGDSATENESDDVNDYSPSSSPGLKKNKKKLNGKYTDTPGAPKNIQCEGSFIVCGMDDGPRSCCIL